MKRSMSKITLSKRAGTGTSPAFICLAFIFIILLTSTSSYASDVSHKEINSIPKAIIGKEDGRKPLIDPFLKGSIGILKSTFGECSAFISDKNTVITAAHCIIQGAEISDYSFSNILAL